jgi:hypothetical protein
MTASALGLSNNAVAAYPTGLLSCQGTTPSYSPSKLDTHSSNLPRSATPD